MADNHGNGTLRFLGQVTLVVGGARGIGRAIAMRLGREGAEVVIADIDHAAAEATIRDMCSERSRARMIVCDVRERRQVEGMVQQVISWSGRIDVLMQIAGIVRVTPFLEMDEATWDDILDTNLRGAYLVAKAVLPHMVERRRGKLVFMSSTNCWDAEAQLAHYNASKAGLYLLAKTLAREFGRYGINSNAVAPGFIRTQMAESVTFSSDFIKKYDPANGLIPLGRAGTPDDVTGPALFLASSDADYVNGSQLFVDGGQLA